MKIIDVHAHVYPSKIAEKASNGIGSFYSMEMRHSGSTDELKKICIEAGISHCVINSVATKPEQVGSINSFIAETAKNDSFFTGLATLYPYETQNIISGHAEHVKKLGLKGVKLHPDFQKFKINSKEAFAVYEILEEENLPLLIHTGDKRFEFSPPDYVPEVLRRFPRLKILAAHFGGWSVWGDAVKLLAGVSENLFVDTSSSLYALSPETALEYIRAFGAEQVLFGTDYPMWTAKEELDMLEKINMTQEEKELLLCRNAEKLFGI